MKLDVLCIKRKYVPFFGCHQGVIAREVLLCIFVQVANIENSHLSIMWCLISLLILNKYLFHRGKDLASCYISFHLIITHLGQNFQWEIKSIRSIHKTYNLPVRMGVIVEVIFTKTKGGWAWLTVPCWEVARPSKPGLSVLFISSPLARQWRNSSFPDFS